ncbi:odorant receptor 2a-like [Cochliomyia hominivorax]
MLLRRPVDTGQTINSFYGLKYLWLNWTITGMHPPATKSKFWLFVYYIYSITTNIVAGIGLPVTMLVNLYFITSWEEVVENLSMSFSIAIVPCKQLVILLNRRRLYKSDKYLKPLDERSSHDPKDRMNILMAIRTCHIYFLIFTLSYFFVTVGFAYIGWNKHSLVYSGWFPEWFSSPYANYVAAFIYQDFAQTFMVFENGNNDAYPLCYLVLMVAHLETLAERIKRIGNGKAQHSIEENTEELKRCLNDHKNLLNYFDNVRPVISATCFLQFLVTAFALCLTAINLMAFDRDITQQFFAIVYLCIIVIQVFPICWHVNVLMEKSDYLTTAMYSCNWMDQNNKFRKMLIIFMQRSQITNTVLAGNLAPVTLQTFLAIIRFSFSMYTIFSQN